MDRAANRPSTFESWLHEESSWDQRHDDREYAPAVSALAGDEQTWRLPRLRRVYATAQQLFLTVENRPLPATVVAELRDERGALTVVVGSEKWQEFLDPFFRLAWRAENEKADAVSFKVSMRSLA